MEISSVPANVYYRLMLVGQSVITVNEPLPGGKPGEPKVWLIIFTPAKTDSTLLRSEAEGDDAEGDDAGEPDGETRWTVPAKYKILMREADNSLGDVVQVHEVWADKVLLATRIVSGEVALEEFTALIKEELGDDAQVDLQDLSSAKKTNGQQQSATT